MILLGVVGMLGRSLCRLEGCLQDARCSWIAGCVAGIGLLRELIACGNRIACGKSGLLAENKDAYWSRGIA